MNAQRTWHYFDEGERRKWQNPEDILKEIGLKAGMTFLDVGCGNGYFTLPAARAVGSAGSVMALDSSPGAIDEIRKRAREEGIANIQLKSARAESALLCQHCADILFFGIVLHDFEDAARVLSNAQQMIKAGGKLANLDWKKIEMPFGPPLAVRFDEAKASDLITAAGFKIDSVRDWGQYNYLILASA